jgi:hypothetical protein
MTFRISLPLVMLLFLFNTSTHCTTTQYLSRLAWVDTLCAIYLPYPRLMGSWPYTMTRRNSPRHVMGDIRQTSAGHTMVHDIKESLSYLYTTSRTYARCARSSESFWCITEDMRQLQASKSSDWRCWGRWEVSFAERESTSEDTETFLMSIEVILESHAHHDRGSRTTVAAQC